MWGRKEDSKPTEPSPSFQPEPPAKPVAPAVQAPPPPQAVVEPDRGGRSTARIGKSLTLKGEITGSDDLYIDGDVEGSIKLEGNSVTVGPNGNVRAEVTAKSITVLGRLRGNVRAAERIEIRKTGSLEGDLVTARIVIEEDAMFRGSIDIVKPGQEQAESAPKPPISEPVVPKPASKAQAVGGNAGSIPARS
jgi:cytoskeletal protein CcmA (bactofilin family)